MSSPSALGNDGGEIIFEAGEGTLKRAEQVFGRYRLAHQLSSE